MRYRGCGDDGDGDESGEVWGRIERRGTVPKLMNVLTGSGRLRVLRGGVAAVGAAGVAGLAGECRRMPGGNVGHFQTGV